MRELLHLRASLLDVLSRALGDRRALAERIMAGEWCLLLLSCSLQHVQHGLLLRLLLAARSAPSVCEDQPACKTMGTAGKSI